MNGSSKTIPDDAGVFIPDAYSERTTIVAAASGYGGSIGVIRLSGPQSISIIDDIFIGSSGMKIRDADSHTIHHGKINDLGKICDEVLVSLMRAPKSYTGEDVVEISAHGSALIVNEIIKICIGRGAVPAQKGEFTKRAFLNGKMDLVQAESVADLVNANTRQAGRIALGLISGNLSSRVKIFKDGIIRWISNIEARIDNPEEDIEPLDWQSMQDDLKSMIEEMERLVNTFSSARVLRDGISVIIAGKPNVGKSSLFNKCISQEKALVSSVPGTTRDVLEADFYHDDMLVRIIDTAGLRKKLKTKVEKMGAEKAKIAVQNQDMILFIFDISKRLTSDDYELAEYFGGKCFENKIIAVANKIDLKRRIPDYEISKLLAKCNAKELVEVSAKTGRGIVKMIDFTIKYAKKEILEVQEPVMLINIRQVNCIKRACEHVKNVTGVNMPFCQESMAACELKSALNALSELVGSVTSEEILENIFRNFCIGK